MEIKINNISVVIKGKHIFSDLTYTLNSGDMVALIGVTDFMRCHRFAHMDCHQIA